MNGWHYPTIATAKGRTTIEVQSLHRGGAVDTAYTSGDATINTEESSCLTGTIAPFERCTYVIDSGGGKGTLHLSDTESVRLNSASYGGSSGVDSGGSAGWATRLPCLGVGILVANTKNSSILNVCKSGTTPLGFIILD